MYLLYLFEHLKRLWPQCADKDNELHHHIILYKDNAASHRTYLKREIVEHHGMEF